MCAQAAPFTAEVLECEAQQEFDCKAVTDAQTRARPVREAARRAAQALAPCMAQALSVVRDALLHAQRQAAQLCAAGAPKQLQDAATAANVAKRVALLRAACCAALCAVGTLHVHAETADELTRSELDFEAALQQLAVAEAHAVAWAQLTCEAGSMFMVAHAAHARELQRGLSAQRAQLCALACARCPPVDLPPLPPVPAPRAPAPSVTEDAAADGEQAPVAEPAPAAESAPAAAPAAEPAPPAPAPTTRPMRPKRICARPLPYAWHARPSRTARARWVLTSPRGVKSYATAEVDAFGRAEFVLM